MVMVREWGVWEFNGVMQFKPPVSIYEERSLHYFGLDIGVGRVKWRFIRWEG